MERFLRSVHSIAIPVNDISASSKWYSEMLGAVPSEYETERYRWLQLGQVEFPKLMLVQVSVATRLQLVCEGYRIGAIRILATDVAKLRRLLESRGLSILDVYRNEDGEEEFLFEDLDCNWITITEFSP